MIFGKELDIKILSSSNQRFHLLPWMEFSEHLPEVISIQVGVDLRGGDAFVSQHFLYCP
jgi:hypothetical protein